MSTQTEIDQKFLNLAIEQAKKGMIFYFRLEQYFKVLSAVPKPYN